MSLSMPLQPRQRHLRGWIIMSEASSPSPRRIRPMTLVAVACGLAILANLAIRLTREPRPSDTPNDEAASFPIGNPTGQKPAVHVRDITNGVDLYVHHADTPSHYPASCVKVMTLLLVREYKAASWTSMVPVPAADVTNPYTSAGINLTTASLKAGDVLSWEDLCYGIILPSGFDACQCAARIIGDELHAAAGNTGTRGIPRFVERMNARAAELG